MSARWAKVGRGLTWYNGVVFVVAAALLFLVVVVRVENVPIFGFKFLFRALLALWLLGMPFSATAGFVLSHKSNNRPGKWVNGVLFVIWVFTACEAILPGCGPRMPTSQHHCGG